MATWIIPLSPEPQSFGITLAGRELRLTVRWYEGGENGWLLDVAEPESRAPILCGVPLAAGCDLLAPYAYLNLGGELRLDGDTPPTLDNLGEEVKLLFVTEEES